MEIESTDSFKLKSSREKELQGLLHKGMFRVLDSITVPASARVYGTRWVDATKTLSNGKKTLKSRLVARNFKDRGAEDIPTPSQTISRVAQRVVIALCANLPGQTYVGDVSQA